MAHTDLHRDGVKERLGRQGRTGIAQGLRQTDGQAVNPLGNRAQANGTVENGVEAGHDGQQSLSRADVRRGLFAPDMLLAGLQRQTVGLVAPQIDGHAHDPPRHIALVLILAGEERGVRTAIPHRHAEALRGADGNVSAHRAGFLEHRQRQKICCHHGHSLGRVQGGDLAGQVTHMAPSAGILEDRTEDSLGLQIFGRTHDHLNPQRQSPGLDHANGLRMAVFIHEERASLRFCHPLGHGHGFRRSRRLVQKTGIGNLKAREVGHHGLIVQQSLQATLGNLGLIGGIGRVPGRIFQDIPLDRRRRHRAIIALPDQRGQHLVAPRNPAHPGQKLMFRQGGPAQRDRLADRGWNGFVDKRIKRRHPDHLQHLDHFRGRGADVAAVREIIRIISGWRKGHGPAL